METLELTEKACRVYVGNLLPKVKEVHLTSKLARFGTIHSVWIARRPPGFAFVRFSTPKEAQRAVEASKNGTMEVLGKTVRVQIAGHKPQQSENNVEREPCARQSEPVESVHCHHGERWRRVSRSRSRCVRKRHRRHELGSVRSRSGERDGRGKRSMSRSRQRRHDSCSRSRERQTHRGVHSCRSRARGVGSSRSSSSSRRGRF